MVSWLCCFEWFRSQYVTLGFRSISNNIKQRARRVIAGNAANVRVKKQRATKTQRSHAASVKRAKQDNINHRSKWHCVRTVDGIKEDVAQRINVLLGDDVNDDQRKAAHVS